MKLVRGRKGQLAHLGEGLHPGLASRPFGNHQDPDGLDRTISDLAWPWAPRQGSTSCLNGVDRIGLALATTVLAVVPIDLDHLDTGPGKKPGQSGSIGTRPFHTDPLNYPEAGQPGKQGRVALGGGIEGFGAEQSAHLIQGGGHVDLAMGVDAASNSTRSFYDGHGHPFLSLSWLRGGSAVPERSDGAGRSARNRPAHHPLWNGARRASTLLVRSSDRRGADAVCIHVI